MNNKGEIGIGAIMITFIAILVGVILFQAIAQQVGETTTLVPIDNSTFAWTNNTAFYITGYRSLDGVTIYNQTSANLVVAANYTVANNQVHPTTGELVVTITPAADLPDASGSWNVTATSAQTLTYIPNSGARSVTGLIAIFFALAIAVVALEPTLRSSVLSLMGK